MSSKNNSWTSFTRVEIRDVPSYSDYQTETKTRRAACAFLSDCGAELKMPQLTIATATVFFHRFFALNPMKGIDANIVAMSSLFLAGKVEETPRKLKHVVEICYRNIYKNNKPLNPNPQKESDEYLQFREQVLHHEFLLLQTLGFDLNVEHPYKTLLVWIKYLKADKELAQIAWNFVNDSLRTTVCLQHSPAVIACACIYLAAKYKKSILGEVKNWWTNLSATLDQLQDISDQILDLYEHSPEMETLKKSIEKDKELDAASSSNNGSAESHHHNNSSGHSTSSSSNNKFVQQQSDSSLGKRPRSRSPSPSAQRSPQRLKTETVT